MDIGDILSSLKPEDIQALQGIASSLMGSGAGVGVGVGTGTGTGVGAGAGSASASVSASSGSGSSFGTDSPSASPSPTQEGERADIRSTVPKTQSTDPTSVNAPTADLRLINDAAGLFRRFGESENDPRCRLIAALKPMLSGERQRKADEAMKIIRLIDMIPALSESGLLKGVFGG